MMVWNVQIYHMRGNTATFSNYLIAHNQMSGFVLRNLMAAFGKILVVEVLHVSGTIIR